MKTLSELVRESWIRQNNEAREAMVCALKNQTIDKTKKSESPED